MFDLHNLGWHSFQQLCLAVSREVLGQTVESFLDSNDGGRDGAFVGKWKRKSAESLSGRFVIQCKFTARPGHTLVLSEIREEIEKAHRLVTQGRCDVYILLTNAGISGKSSEKIEAAFKTAGAKHVVTFGSTWIEQQIRTSKRLRMMVPRVYGLGDLSQILDERAYAQAKAVLESMREDLAKVVLTESYQRAVQALDKHRFVLLVGEPAAGKTTIASMLAMASADQWGASVLKLDHPRAVVDHWNPQEPLQFFWIDDSFGVTQYESSLVSGWNHVLPQVKSMLRQGHRIVMTSRDYIYNRARDELKEGAFPLLRESQVVIDVHELTANERRQILYNHLKLGTQSGEFRVAIKPHLELIASHQRFIPEIARRISDPLFTRKLSVSEWGVTDFVERREQFLIELIRGLDAHSKAALALVYMRNERLLSPISVQSSEEEALKRLGSDLGGCVKALEALRGSLVIFSVDRDDQVWKFKHPTVGDAYSTILRDNPELLGIYVRGSSPDKLIDQVTCGDVQIERAVVLPRSLWALVLERLSAYTNSQSYKASHLSSWGAKRNLQQFLAQRCSKEFLESYLVVNPDTVESISRPSLYLAYSSEAMLATRLFELGLLPEPQRRQFVLSVCEYAISGQDLGAINDAGIRSVLTESELIDLKHSLRMNLLPRVADVRRNIEADFGSRDDAESHMYYFKGVLSGLEKEFSEDKVVVESITKERERVEEWISENSSSDEDKSPRELGAKRDSDSATSDRSIFDDIEL